LILSTSKLRKTATQQRTKAWRPRRSEMHGISSFKKGAVPEFGQSSMMERKIVCDLTLVSVDFGREEELRPGNTFRIAFRHANGQPTGTIEVYQGEADHFIVELEAVAAFIRAALVTQRKSQ
jgi:hypothetical protein